MPFLVQPSTVPVVVRAVAGLPVERPESLAQSVMASGDVSAAEILIVQVQDLVRGGDPHEPSWSRNVATGAKIGLRDRVEIEQRQLVHQAVWRTAAERF